MDFSHSTRHRSHPRREAPPFWSFKLLHIVCLQVNNSINHFYRREALRGLLAALVRWRQGRAGGTVSGTEWELPAGSSVTTSQLRLSCSHRACTVWRPGCTCRPAQHCLHPAQGNLYVDALRQILLHPVDLFLKLGLSICLCRWRCSFISVAGAKCKPEFLKSLACSL